MDRRRFDALPAVLVLTVAAAFAAAWMTWRTWRQTPTADDAVYGPPEIRFATVRFGDVPGWTEDNQAAALPALSRSCARIETQPAEGAANPAEALGPEAPGPSLSGRVGDWLPACAAAKALASRTFPDAGTAAGAARRYFEEYFRPVRITALRRARRDGPNPRAPAEASTIGKFTGYFEPTYDASPEPTKERSAPALARPDDLVTVDLGAFREEFAGKRIAGRVEAGALLPYADRKAIEAGALGARARPLAWLHPDDLFFLQIQGSGRLAMPDGATLRIGFDGQNGRPYVPIGRVLIKRGLATKESMSMQTIRDWLAAAPPDAAAELRGQNPSYVFFRILDDLPDPDLGPLGAEGVQLTALRSLAVDRRYYAMGTPAWIALRAPDGSSSLRRLMIAQDAGGAISGPLRGDVYFGSGAVAGDEAGRLDAPGELFMLVPAQVAALLPAQLRPR